jgi:FSR family fosmidomycin resistance protein-like MFS transporter
MSESTKYASSKTVFPILFAVSFGHLLNDLIQATLAPMYPLLKEENGLTFGEIGLITFAFQITSSLLQPVVGTITDRYPQPFSFSFGMIFSISGIILLSFAGSFATIILAACMIGLGSSVFHPEASRVAYSASGGRRSFAQAIFQLGGNSGTALGPLLFAFIVLPYGQRNVIWFTIVGIIGFAVLFFVGKWYKGYLEHHKRNKTVVIETPHGISKRRVQISIGILLILIFSKYFYQASITNYFIFYLEKKFHLPEHESQLLLFVYLFTVTLGTVIGGLLGDKYGRRNIIWFSILGAAPFTLAMPYMNLTWTIIFLGIAGLIIASAFSSILVYAQELLPGKIGMISGLFYGFAFGMAGVGAAVLGDLIENYGIITIYHICSFLPLLGIAAAFLPSFRPKKS